MKGAVLKPDAMSAHGTTRGAMETLLMRSRTFADRRCYNMQSKSKVFIDIGTAAIISSAKSADEKVNANRVRQAVHIRNDRWVKPWNENSFLV
nr:hypothetical protein BaRGS_029509 [Batillaria attramentaria]